MQNNTTQIEPFWMRRLNAVVLENLSDCNLTNINLAKKLSISNRQLYRMVQEYTGLSPNHHIRNIRLKRAYKLLELGTLTVKEVTVHVGFQKTDYFTRLFKAEFGTTPFMVKKNNLYLTFTS